MAGISERVAYADSYLSFLYMRTVRKEAGLHEVLRNVSLVETDLSEAVRDEVAALRANPEAHVAWADIRVPDTDSEKLSPAVAEFLKNPEGFVVLSPGSAWETKRWHTEGFRGVASSLEQRSTRVVIVGAPSDREVCEQVARGTNALNVCGQTSLEDLIALIRRASCVVCNDSLALHVCSATKTPVVVVFCATSPRFGFGPWRNRAVVLEKTDLFCKPCRRHGSRSCPIGTNACMTGVSSAEVVCAVDAFLGEQGGRGSAVRLRVVES
jgi:heptosyltransferase-2